MKTLNIKKLITGITLSALLFTSVSFGANLLEKIEVSKNSINLKVNGKEVKTDNFIYEGRTYVQMRAVAEMLEKDVAWDETTRTASINEIYYVESPKQKEIIPVPTSTPTPVETPIAIPKSTPTKQVGYSKIVDKGYISNGDYTMYAVEFDDGLVLAVPLIVESFHVTKKSVILCMDFKEESFDINLPKITAYSEVFEKTWYPIAVDRYDVSEELEQKYKEIDFYTKFRELNSASKGGSLVYDTIIKFDQLHYNDGVHKCILYLE